eukprot:CAMPEP_0196229782 /NCGR_PEP_ID=MMETSP0913-20130531/1241_1 /TAXON_ID=49265 /ORGANISM="Thalassiosira rotula, Strain GSO102" /LENGTH=77 /DNA_ID=CAMNT_0041509707 /DNA_START=218 /DNA_END=451 /DNA_ORIENTATION=+
MSLSPSSSTHILGESPSTSQASGSAPASNNILTDSAFMPALSAVCKTPMPSQSITFTSAPFFINNFKQSMLPLSAAK